MLRRGPRSWGCCFAITESDGAANGERRRMIRTPHEELRAASAEGRALPARAHEATEALDVALLMTRCGDNAKLDEAMNSRKR
jgi:hypothetical protein